MKPTTNRLLVRVEKIEAPAVKEGEAPSPVRVNMVMTAKVLKAGPEAKGIKVDDTVHFSPYGFDEVYLDGEKLVIISEDLILAVNE